MLYKPQQLLKDFSCVFMKSRATIVSDLFQHKCILRVDVVWVELVEKPLCEGGVLVHTGRYTTLVKRGRFGAVTKSILHLINVYLAQVVNDGMI